MTGYVGNALSHRMYHRARAEHDEQEKDRDGKENKGGGGLYIRVCQAKQVMNLLMDRPSPLEHPSIVPQMLAEPPLIADPEPVV